MLLDFQVDGRSGMITSMLPVASTNCNLPEAEEICMNNQHILSQFEDGSIEPKSVYAIETNK